MVASEAIATDPNTTAKATASIVGKFLEDITTSMESCRCGFTPEPTNLQVRLYAFKPNNQGYQSSPPTSLCSTDVLRATPSQSATDPLALGRSHNSRTASRISSGTLLPVRSDACHGAPPTPRSSGRPRSPASSLIPSPGQRFPCTRASSNSTLSALGPCPCCSKPSRTVLRARSASSRRPRPAAIFPSSQVRRSRVQASGKRS